MSQNTTDFMVIGGGITGASTAYQLALRGHRVTLLEKKYIGAGGTGRTGGIIRQHYSTETSARMALRALQVWRDFDNVVGGNPGWVQTGVLFFVGRGDTEGLKQNVAMLQRLGIRTEVLDSAAIHAVAPYIAVEDIGAGAYEPDSGYADGALAANAFANRARDLGAVIRQGIRVTGITAQSGRVTGVDTDAGHFSAPVVINAAGPWGTGLAKTAGYDTPVEASRHQIAVFQRPPEFTVEHHIVIGDFIQGCYMRSETGRLTLAGSLEVGEADHKIDPDNFVETVDMDFNADMAERTERRLPVMGNARVAKGWAGFYDVSPDWHPIIGHMPGLAGFICAYGFSGSGFKMGPVVGEMVADLAIGERRCPIDPHPFRFERFAEGALNKGLYEYSIIG
jgi:glycine/D-amino acid oxidase-like deaminating enzyme